MKILIADDDKIFKELTKIVLSEAGYSVITAENGAQAWETLQKEGADILVTDVNMPEMSGFELTNKIREDKKFSKIPILMLTIRDMNEDIVSGYEYGADDYLAKPFENEVLLARVKKLEQRILGK